MNKNKKRVYRNKRLKEFFATLIMGVTGEIMTILGVVSLVSTFLIKLLGPRPFFMVKNPEGSVGSFFWSMMVLSNFIVVFGIILLCRVITIEKRSEKKEELETEKEDEVEEKEIEEREETEEDEIEEKDEIIEDEDESPVRDMEQEIEKEEEEIEKEQTEMQKDEEEKEEKTEEDVEEIENCPVCGTNVSPDDEKCPICDESLRQMDEV